MFNMSPRGELTRYWDLPDKQIANNSRVGSVSVYTALCASGIPFSGVTKPSKPVFMLVREPTSRFLSAKKKGPVEPFTGNHFGLQSDIAQGPRVFLYRFPDHLEQFGRDTGLGVIPWVNKSNSCMEITKSERKKMEKDFQKDFELWESIIVPGFERREK